VLESTQCGDKVSDVGCVHAIPAFAFQGLASIFNRCPGSIVGGLP
jgi:hypothetical protein